MNFTIISSVVTVISMLVFIGILLWAYSSKNRAHFEEMAQLPTEHNNENESGK